MNLFLFAGFKQFLAGAFNIVGVCRVQHFARYWVLLLLVQCLPVLAEGAVETVEAEPVSAAAELDNLAMAGQGVTMAQREGYIVSNIVEFLSFVAPECEPVAEEDANQQGYRRVCNVGEIDHLHLFMAYVINTLVSIMLGAFLSYSFYSSW